MKFDLAQVEIKSSLKYKMMLFAGALIHVTFFVFFSIARISFMSVFNIFSVLFYLLGALLADTKIFDKSAYAWCIALYIEITCHGVIATFILGTDTSFYMYILEVLPIGAYILFFTTERRRFWRTMVTLTIITTITMAVTLFVVASQGTLMETMYGRSLTDTEVTVMRGINIFFITVLIICFTLLFLLEIITLVNTLNRTNEQLEYTATHDNLTGLFNRHSLKKVVTDLEDGKARYCVMLGDIDDFKKVNDTYGHDAGDLVLKTVAAKITENLFGQDTACRWGGEEMLIILRGGKADCMSRAKQIRESIINEEMEHEGKLLHVTMTFGFVDCTELPTDLPGEITHFEGLITLADKRLYRGKESGKNKIVSK